MNKISDIILLGDPASGKATQGKKLVKKYKLINIDIGEQLRAIARKTPNLKLRNVFKKTLQSGKLTPTALVRRILKEQIIKAPKNRALLFNGTPKMLGEAKLVSKFILKRGKPIVIFLSIPEREIIKRINSRKEYFKGKFSKREDDNLKALKNRIKYYHKNIKEVLDFFKKQYPFAVISGLGSRAEVSKRINNFIKKNG